MAKFSTQTATAKDKNVSICRLFRRFGLVSPNGHVVWQQNHIVQGFPAILTAAPVENTREMSTAFRFCFQTAVAQQANAPPPLLFGGRGVRP